MISAEQRAHRYAEMSLRRYLTDDWYTLNDRDLEACVEQTETLDQAMQLATQTHQARISREHG